MNIAPFISSAAFFLFLIVVSQAEPIPHRQTCSTQFNQPCTATICPNQLLSITNKNSNMSVMVGADTELLPEEILQLTFQDMLTLQDDVETSYDEQGCVSVNLHLGCRGFDGCVGFADVLIS